MRGDLAGRLQCINDHRYQERTDGKVIKRKTNLNLKHEDITNSKTMVTMISDGGKH